MLKEQCFGHTELNKTVPKWKIKIQWCFSYASNIYTAEVTKS